MSTSYIPVETKELKEEPVVIDKSTGPPVFRQFLAAFTCSILALLYGQTIGWSSIAVPQFQEGILAEGPISKVHLGWIGGAPCVAALISSPFHGLLADAKGRKFTAYLIGIAFLVNWGILFTAEKFWTILVARFISGIGGAGTITLVSIYNNEVASPTLKASLGGLMVMGFTLGILNAYILGALLSYSSCIMIYLCCSLVFFPAWWFMPESPAYLVLSGNDEKALTELRWLLGKEGTHASDAVERLKREQAGAVKPASLKQFFKSPAARKGLVFGMVLFSIQTFSGVFAVLSYASGIISRSGAGISPFTASLLYGGLMVAGSLLPPLIADRLPRRVLLGISCTLLSTGMAMLGTFQYLRTQGLDTSAPGSFLGWIPVIVLSATVFSHFIGLGSITYVTIMELFSDETRGVAASLTAIVMWGTSFILLQFFHVAVETLGDHVVFFFFSFVCAFGLFFTYTILPETRGKSAEEMAAILTK